MENPIGFISKIQRYATKDGPGLRSTVFTVGCNLKCVWCANPELIGAGSKILYHKERCQRCGRCVAAAVNGSITMTEDGVLIDRARCENIAACAESCYFDAYETVGYEITAAALVEKLLRDKAFYQKSGGGVTFSGGEAALQHAFVASAARRLRAVGVQTALDTAGNVPWPWLRDILTYADTVLYDIKAFDSKLHEACTGVPNQLVLENAKKIAAMDVAMYIRMVIVPSRNDDLDDITKRLHFIQELGANVKQVDLLKYHKLGQGKYNQLGLDYPLDVGACEEAMIQEIAERAQAMGLRVSVGG